MEIRLDTKELNVIKEGKKTENKTLNYELLNYIEGYIECEPKMSKSEIIETILSDNKTTENKINEILENTIKSNDQIRSLRHDALFTTSKVTNKEIYKSNRVVALFESSFTRALGLDDENVNDSVIIVKVYHYKVLKDLIDKAFLYNNERYIFWSASSGQMKNKKCVFVKESALTEKRKNDQGEIYTVADTLTCGLDWDRINNTAPKKDKPDEKGININKFNCICNIDL